MIRKMENEITTVHPGGQLSRHVPEPLFVPTRAERGRIGLLEGVGGGWGGGGRSRGGPSQYPSFGMKIPIAKESPLTRLLLRTSVRVSASLGCPSSSAVCACQGRGIRQGNMNRQTAQTRSAAPSCDAFRGRSTAGER